MLASAKKNRQFLVDLFAGEFRGHAIIMDPLGKPFEKPDGDAAVSEAPVKDWLPCTLQMYEDRLRWHLMIGDDSVPWAGSWVGTEFFAACFGAPVKIDGQNIPFALPLVCTSEEADKLEAPSLNVRLIERIFELYYLAQERLGTDVPVGVPDIQSPFDIAALIWRKQDMFIAMREEPEAVKRLVDKCYQLLTSFFTEFKKQFPICSMSHCPYAYGPEELGIWLSEDEAGSMSVRDFEEFCLPTLTRLSEDHGGLFMHCCAAADHQYDNFNKIPNLRGINRVFQAVGPRPAIKAFENRTVIMQAWWNLEKINGLLDMALPGTRFLLNMGPEDPDDSKRTYEALRARCPRS